MPLDISDRRMTNSNNYKENTAVAELTSGDLRGGGARSSRAALVWNTVSETTAIVEMIFLGYKVRNRCDYVEII